MLLVLYCHVAYKKRSNSTYCKITLVFVKCVYKHTKTSVSSADIYAAVSPVTEGFRR